MTTTEQYDEVLASIALAMSQAFDAGFLNIAEALAVIGVDLTAEKRRAADGLGGAA